MNQPPDLHFQKGLRPTVRMPRRRQLLNLLRNAWILRRDLWAIIRRKRRPQREEGIPLICLACRRDLTKTCARGRARHLIVWPQEADGLGSFAAGQLVEVRRQKPRGGQYDHDDDFRPLLRNGEPVFR